LAAALLLLVFGPPKINEPNAFDQRGCNRRPKPLMSMFDLLGRFFPKKERN